MWWRKFFPIFTAALPSRLAKTLHFPFLQQRSPLTLGGFAGSFCFFFGLPCFLCIHDPISPTRQTLHVFVVFGSGVSTTVNFLASSRRNPHVGEGIRPLICVFLFQEPYANTQSGPNLSRICLMMLWWNLSCLLYRSHR